MEEEGNVNAHLSRMFNLRTELADLQYIVNELDMQEALLASLPTTTQFNQLRQTVWFASDSAAYSPEKICELIRTAAALHEETTSGFGIGVFMSVKRKDVDRQRDKKTSHMMSKGSNANVYKGHIKTKDNKKRCYSCGSSEHLKRLSRS